MTSRFRICSILALGFLTGGCRYSHKELAFTPQELVFTNPYHTDDTLYFFDRASHCDTILIKSIGKDQNDGFGLKNKAPVYNRIWVTAEHLQSDYWRGATKSTKGNREITFQNIIMVEKLPQKKETDIAIEFRNFHYATNLEKVGMPDSTPVTLGTRTLSKYYLFPNQKLGSMTDSTNISAVYWTPEEGLVAYKNTNGNVWVKKEK